MLKIEQKQGQQQFEDTAAACRYQKVIVQTEAQFQTKKVTSFASITKGAIMASKVHSAQKLKPAFRIVTYPTASTYSLLFQHIVGPDLLEARKDKQPLCRLTGGL
eukprot:1105843-Pelagomonas_calceolata.AAC.3